MMEIGARESAPPMVLDELRLKKILVPVDFSDCSDKALRYAISFARQFQAELFLLHVVETFYPPPELIMAESAAVEQKSLAEAEKELSRWKRRTGKIPGQSVVCRGSPQREIVSLAEENNIDLIVLGTHGRSGMAHLLLGSTAERVARHAPCPVLIVRTVEHDFIQETAAQKRAWARMENRGRSPRHPD
jgi:nucleotide-binding universal stress UspA family protein